MFQGQGPGGNGLLQGDAVTVSGCGARGACSGECPAPGTGGIRGDRRSELAALVGGHLLDRGVGGGTGLLVLKGHGLAAVPGVGVGVPVGPGERPGHGERAALGDRLGGGLGVGELGVTLHLDRRAVLEVVEVAVIGGGLGGEAPVPAELSLRS